MFSVEPPRINNEESVQPSLEVSTLRSANGDDPISVPSAVSGSGQTGPSRETESVPANRVITAELSITPGILHLSIFERCVQCLNAIKAFFMSFVFEPIQGETWVDFYNEFWTGERKVVVLTPPNEGNSITNPNPPANDSPENNVDAPAPASNPVPETVVTAIELLAEQILVVSANPSPARVTAEVTVESASLIDNGDNVLEVRSGDDVPTIVIQQAIDSEVTVRTEISALVVDVNPQAGSPETVELVALVNELDPQAGTIETDELVVLADDRAPQAGTIETTELMALVEDRAPLNMQPLSDPSLPSALPPSDLKPVNQFQEVEITTGEIPANQGVSPDKKKGDSSDSTMSADGTKTLVPALETATTSNGN